MGQHYAVTGVRTVNRESTTVWLSWDDGGGGAYQWSTDFDDSEVFASKEEALSAAGGCPGPWFNEPDKKTIEAVLVDYSPPQPAKLSLAR